MADAGLFIGWGSEVVLLYPHGGDLYGFILVRGSQEQLNGLQADEEFMRFNTRLSIALAGHTNAVARRPPATMAASAPRTTKASAVRRRP